MKRILLLFVIAGPCRAMEQTITRKNLYGGVFAYSKQLSPENNLTLIAKDNRKATNTPFDYAVYHNRKLTSYPWHETNTLLWHGNKGSKAHSMYLEMEQEYIAQNP